MTNEKDSKQLKAIATSLTTLATAAGAVHFLKEFACEGMGIPWVGVFLLIGSLAGFFVDFVLYTERAAHDDRFGTNVAVITLIIMAGFFLFGILFLFEKIC